MMPAVRLELEDTAAALPGEQAPSALDRTATFEARASLTGAPIGSCAPGQQLGHFRIERKLGAGGMGEVYLATDLALDRPVAVKVLPETLAGDARLRERLIREARAQARVIHPNIAHIYFIGEERGLLYFAMEYIAGVTVSERVAAGPLPAEQALGLIRSAALGLREAQRSGFTHRDVKPSNLMIDPHGVLKVLDFGLVASASSSEAAGDAAGPVAQTSLAGTPLYMSPEQASGGVIDFRSDIYALGVTLFQLVTGQPPFVADTLDALRTLHASAARPVVPRRRGHLRTQIAAIDALCARMMAPRPEDRFASYDELLRAIEFASLSFSRPGGFLPRLIATGLDTMLAMAAVAIIGALLSLFDREWPDTNAISFLLMGIVHAFAVARWGRTPGKAVFELEVVDLATARAPSLARSIRRSAVMFGIPLAVCTLAWLAVATIDGLSGGYLDEFLKLSIVALMVIGPTILLYASRRNVGNRAIWDRIAGTMVRYRPVTTELR